MRILRHGGEPAPLDARGNHPPWVAPMAIHPIVARRRAPNVGVNVGKRGTIGSAIGVRADREAVVARSLAHRDGAVEHRRARHAPSWPAASSRMLDDRDRWRPVMASLVAMQTVPLTVPELLRRTSTVHLRILRSSEMLSDSPGEQVARPGTALERRRGYWRAQ